MEKRQDIEFLRIISAFGIVWFHSGAIGHAVSYSGLMVFLILSTYLSKKSTAAGLFRKRFERFIVPWMFWFVVYAVENIVRGEPIINAKRSFLAGVLAGPSIHLWYMPFMFFCLVTLDTAKRHLPPMALCLTSAALAILIMAVTPSLTQPLAELGYPAPQYGHGVVGVLVGIFLLYFDVLPGKTRWLICATMIFVATQRLPYAGIENPSVIGMVLCFVLASGITQKIRSVDFTPLSQCTLGIYFIHILFLDLAAKARIFHGIRGPLVVFVASAITVYYLRRAFPRLAKYWS